MPFNHMLGMGQPIEFIIFEMIYLILIIAFCAMIYFRTKTIYKLTKHEGVFFFRTTFFYFGIAFFFRFIHVSMKALSKYVTFNREIIMLSLPFVGYFSTVAVLFLAMTVLSRNIRIRHLFLHLIAFVITIFVFLSNSQILLVLLQTIIIMIAMVIVLIKRSKKASFNKITYLLLFILWIINILITTRRLIPMTTRLVLYAVSLIIFISIYYRVHKRLPNAKKKR